ncbi:MAG: hypothetical protein AABO58_05315 [Acidobacteriota bacterium]
MKGLELYRQWAPPDDVWSPWVKAPLFAEITAAADRDAVSGQNVDPGMIGDMEHTVVIVDMPGAESLDLGFALAAKGFRPVPLYNTTSGAAIGVKSAPSAVIDMTSLKERLAIPLSPAVRERISRGAPPVFLLDRRRLNPEKQPEPGKYDNRWMVFPQDFPSAPFLRERGIRRVVLIQPDDSQPQDDLTHVLLRWQESGIEVFLQQPGRFAEPLASKVKRPRMFRSVFYRALAMMGLRKNAAGGFGSVIPMPGEGSGGGFG